MTLTPRADTVRMSSSTVSTSVTASAAVGSSRISTCGSNETARAIATACRWPPERLRTSTFVSGMRMLSASSWRRASACMRRLSRNIPAPARGSRPRNRFDATSRSSHSARS
jgi:hypothetical protein